MSDPKAQDDAKSDRYLPYSRIRTIMKSSADPVSLSIKEESLQLVCRATEMFVQMLAKESHKSCSKLTKLVDYKHLAEYVQSEERLEFLHQIVPKKITVKQFRDIMAKKRNKRDNSSDTSSSGSESGSGSGSGGDDDEDDNDEEAEEEEDEQEENAGSGGHAKKGDAKKGRKDSTNVIKTE